MARFTIKESGDGMVELLDDGITAARFDNRGKVLHFLRLRRDRRKRDYKAAVMEAYEAYEDAREMAEAIQELGGTHV